MDERDPVRTSTDPDHALPEQASLIRLLQVVAIAANEAASIESALQACLAAVCTRTGWPVGHALLMRDGELVSTGVWQIDELERYERFRAQTEELRFRAGHGLLGQVLEHGKAAWVADVSEDPSFLRSTAAEVGLHAGVAFPILVGREVVGALEFFCPRPAEPDEALLEVMFHVGTQVGRVVERARAEEALRLSEAKFAGIVSISSDAIVSVDEEQRIVLFNQGAEATFGYTAEEVLGRELELLIPERFRGAHREQVQRFGDSPVQARRMGERGQISGRRKNGEVFPADASISKMEIDGRRIYTAVLRDVTDRVRAEQALEHQAEELSRSNKELEQFAYVASHDLQEPLRKIQAFGDRLATKYLDSLDETGRDYLSRMHNAAERMQGLINDLLSFSRVTTKAQPFEQVDLAEVTQGVISDLELRIEQSEGEVETGPLPVLEADPVQMRQLMQNLVGNALKYRRPEAPPVVRISAVTLGDGAQGTRQWCEISVADNGIGFDEKYLDRIFGLFQRLHSRSEYEGTGMGLAICRKIAERHGGSITAQSRPGEGATFIVTLPLTQTQGAQTFR